MAQFGMKGHAGENRPSRCSYPVAMAEL